ncbi:hypothetical protein B0H66DRAFT_611357 [Apodospora peruviana]|uniref:Transmembrane protein n=1 Tax=Apodospora peruviana TaxID=516989 RepID=A0AAE0MF25_9PEZI|nr:hypothetical protein B0H66DRAFT_611357 [Apodospora peruviana]
MVVHRKPVASPRALSYDQSLAEQSSGQSPIPIALQPIHSASEAYTVSPPSSIHQEDREIHDGTASHYRDQHGFLSSPVSSELELAPVTAPPPSYYQHNWQTDGDIEDPENHFAQDNLHTNDSAQLSPQYQQYREWQESQGLTTAQQELAEARAREVLLGRGPRVTSYGPAPGPTLPPVSNNHRHTAPAVVVLTATLPSLKVSPPQPSPGGLSIRQATWQGHHHHRTSRGDQRHQQGIGNGRESIIVQRQQQQQQQCIENERHDEQEHQQHTHTQNEAETGRGGEAPFMHYQDLDTYFQPSMLTKPENEPEPETDENNKFKDYELGGGIPAAKKGKMVVQVSRWPGQSAVDIIQQAQQRQQQQQQHPVRADNSCFPTSENMNGNSASQDRPESFDRQQQRQLTMTAATVAAVAIEDGNNNGYGGKEQSNGNGGGPGAEIIGGNDNHSYDDHDHNHDHHHTDYPNDINVNINTDANTNRLNNHTDNNMPNNPARQHHPIDNQNKISAWLPEISYSLVSIASVAAIIVIMHLFNGRNITAINMPISLNTLIAFLAAVCQLCLLQPVIQGLGQLKWNWFARRERPLADFAIFDDAVTTSGGGLKLLGTGKGRTLGISASVVLLTAFLSSPLTQAAITYRTRLVRSDAGGAGLAAVAARRSAIYPPSNNNVEVDGISDGEPPQPIIDSEEKRKEKADNQPGLPHLDMTQMKRAIQSGIHHLLDSSSPPQLPPDIQPSCSSESGECRWPRFSSMAVCVDVADVSDKLTIANLTTTTGTEDDGMVYNASLPNGVYLLGSPTTCNLNMSSPRVANQQPASASLAFADQDGKVPSAIVNLFVIYTNQMTSPNNAAAVTFRAVEALLHFCVNTYEGVTSRGVSTTTLVNMSTSVMTSAGQPAAVRRPSTSTSIKGRRREEEQGLLRLQTSHDDDDQVVYSVNLTDAWILHDHIVSVLSGTYSFSSSHGSTSTSEVLGATMFRPFARRRGVAGSNSPVEEEEEEDGRLQAAVQNLLQNVATTLTNTIRLSGSGTAAAAAATGVTMVPETYVHIQWAWLTFLAVQVVLSAAFLMGIIVQTAVWKVKVFKSSSMATLFAIESAGKVTLERENNMFLLEQVAVPMTRSLGQITGRLGLDDRV